uniref:Phosphoadenosine phosphosulfate reductase n=1 Tax=Paulinella micropora TaxID=1928728 RepID=A0A385I110_9EUKA|nr:phosphoadenosine phosphosulfate reductase [Paulinella micropora]AXY63578.1 phosphoadenosine phosphosulfate reductase [Paulinella micropora]
MSTSKNIQQKQLPLTSRGESLDLEVTRDYLTTLTPQERLNWGLRTFEDKFTLTTSFGIQSAVSLHMLSQLQEKVQVIWIDTGYLPLETYQYAETLCELFSVSVWIAQSSISPARMEALYGRLWETGSIEDLEKYHQIRKVEPLENAFEMNSVSCWASGVRGNQTDHRSSMSPLDSIRGRWSLRPLLNWTKKDIFYYMKEYNILQHPLFDKGYSTVGDWHSSAPDGQEISGRSTRFGGLKQECGIHVT